MPAPTPPDDSSNPSSKGRGLSAIERKILDFERAWQSHHGAKVQAIRERFGVSPTTYYSWRAALIERPEAMAYTPVTVRQLRRSRGSEAT